MKTARLTTTVKEDAVTKLVVREAGFQIRIEVTPVLRGCAFDAEMRDVSPAVEAMFGFAEMRVVRLQTYAGKIMAALDRKHPAISSTFVTCWPTKVLMTP